MSEQQSSDGIERVIFEPVREGKWRMRLEGGDVEGHGFRIKLQGGDVEGHGMRVRFRSAEPAGEAEGGEQLYELSFEGEDVEGQAYRGRG